MSFKINRVPVQTEFCTITVECFFKQLQASFSSSKSFPLNSRKSINKYKIIPGAIKDNRETLIRCHVFIVFFIDAFRIKFINKKGNCLNIYTQAFAFPFFLEIYNFI